MSEKATAAPEQSISTPEQLDGAKPAKTGSEKVQSVQSYMTMVSTGLGILGAVGTGFVWLYCNFYTGELDFKPSNPVDMLTVKVSDTKGHQSIYYTKQVHLMPGTYHVEVEVPNGTAQHFDTTVEFHKTNTIAVEVPASPDAKTEKKKGHRWFLFWRRGDEE
jgi:hypothetical protein